MLSLLLFARFGQVLNSLLIASGRTFPLSAFYQFFTPLYFAAPACFFLYITGFVYQKNDIKKYELIHFLPALLAIVHVIPWPGLAPLNWNVISAELQIDAYHSLREKSGLFPSYVHYLIRPLLTVFYLVLTWVMVIKSKILWKQTIDSVTRGWVLFLLNVATFFQLLGFLPRLLRHYDVPISNITFLVINCIGVLMILVYAIHKPRIFYGFLLVAIDWNKNEWKDKLKNNYQSSTADLDLAEIIKLPKVTAHPGKKINLSEDQISLYAQLIKNEMEGESLYLNMDLQIIDLAMRINIPVHQCSFVINNHIGKNFRDWINSYRIEHFLSQYPLLADKMTIEAIAQESGFKSQATFYNAFKKEKGLMPTAYFSQELGV